MTALGSLIRKKRWARGLSLLQLAVKIGAAQSYLHELETGKRANPSILYAARLGRALGIGITTMAKLAEQDAAAADAATR